MRLPPSDYWAGVLTGIALGAALVLATLAYLP